MARYVLREWWPDRGLDEICVPFAIPAWQPLEPTIGFEPMTSSLPRKCSTPELRGPVSLRAAASPVEPALDGACGNLEIVLLRFLSVKPSPPGPSPRARSRR